MQFKWPFSRYKSDVPDMPPEIQQYYTEPQSPSRSRRLILAGLALLVAAGIGAAVYFLGPWNGSSSTTGTPSTAKHGGAAGSGGQSPSTGGGSSSGSSNNGGSGSKSGTSGSAKAGNGTQSGSSTQTKGQGGNAPAGPGAIVNTGPGDTVAIFVGVVTAGAVAYELRLRRRFEQ